jgi:CoA:oxalate CoA-transferase
MPGPLDGIRVIDFTHALAAPFGTMVLADLGAEVINVVKIDERDETRGPGPFVNGRSTFRFSIERGKKGIQIDLKRPEGLELALDLADRSDVLTENFTPGALDRLGLGYDAVSKRNPRLIYASCSGFGHTGPYSNRGGVDVVIQAMSGLLSITGEADGRPMRTGASFGDSIAGAHFAMGIITALYERERSGKGQRLDISMLGAMVYHLENAVVRQSVGDTPKRIGPRHPLSTPFQPFETADGWIVVAGTRDWPGLCVVIGREELADDPRFETNPGRTAHHAELEPILIEAFRAKTSEEWLRLLEGICLAAPVYSIAEMIDDPHIKATDTIVQLPVPGPEERSVLVANSPLRLSRTPPRVDTPGPATGEHTRQVLEELLEMLPERIAELEASGVVRCKED